MKRLLYDFVSARRNTAISVWKMTDITLVENVRKAFARTFDSISDIYIADGHHRAASAVKVGIEDEDEENPGYTGR